MLQLLADNATKVANSAAFVSAASTVTLVLFITSRVIKTVNRGIRLPVTFTRNLCHEDLRRGPSFCSDDFRLGPT